MKLESKFFDRIRIKPRHRDEQPRPQSPHCAWEGCKEAGIYRAPKGNRAEGEYHNFCLEHVRHYNSAYNFFSGMDAAGVEEHINRSAQTDGRPSWGMGSKPGGSGGPRMPNGKLRNPDAKKFADPLHIFARYARAQARGPQREPVRPLHEPDRRALETLGMEGRPNSDEIKKAYKALVKIHHPDANGGNKASEDRLRSIIAAYSHLKAKGFVGS
jgi:DnaJ-domain-containing protein 1